MKDELSQYSDADLFYMLDGDKKSAEPAFAELYQRHSSRVYAYCRRFLNDAEEAKDVFQEIFVKFFESASENRDMTNVAGFLLKIARNQCMNSVRTQKQTVSFEEYMVGTNTNRLEKDELLNLIKTALELLPPEYKDVFLLREYEGLSYQEIAEVTETPLSTIKVRIYRAKQKIREILQPYTADLIKHE